MTSKGKGYARIVYTYSYYCENGECYRYDLNIFSDIGDKEVDELIVDVIRIGQNFIDREKTMYPL